MKHRSHIGIVPWVVIVNLFWTYLWRSTLFTILITTLVKSVIHFTTGHPLNEVDDGTLLFIVSVPVWLFSFKLALESHWLSLATIEKSYKPLRDALEQHQDNAV